MDKIIGDLDEISIAVARFRKALEASAADLGDAFALFPRGCCGNASILLANYLREQRLGLFELVSGCRDEVSHAWLEGGGMIVDVTIDQFHDAPPGSFVLQNFEWHEQFSRHREREEEVDISGDRERLMQYRTVRDAAKLD